MTIEGHCVALDLIPEKIGAPSKATGDPPSPSLDLADLTQRLKRGDEAAYRIFYEAYFDRLSRYLLVVTAGDEDRMREAMQATLVRVVKHIKVFSDESIFWSWLTVLARSALFDEGRRRRRYWAFLARFSYDARVTASPDLDTSGKRDLLRQALQETLSQLSLDERTLVERKYHEDRSIREIAHEFDASEKAIESKLSRVRRKLKDGVLLKLKHGAP